MKLLTTKFLLGLLLFSLNLFATHDYGGSIYWKCVDNGKFQFFLEFYRNCTGIPVTNGSISMEIFGSPLPEDEAGLPFSSITMNYKGAKDLSPSCNSSGSPFSCSDKTAGTVEKISYASDTIVLNGKPPRSGWSFSWEPDCCRSGLTKNIVVTNGTARTLLRAILYRNGKGSVVDSCYDSSPQFVAEPTILGCRGQEIHYLNSATDVDFDELRYSWASAYYGPISSPAQITYATKFSASNPTPDEKADSNNIPSTINAKTGLVKLKVNNGKGIVSYLKVVQVDAYDNGRKIASIFRELPISIVDCNLLEDSTTNQNPEIRLDTHQSSTIKITATAGERIKIPITVNDSDLVNDSAKQHQELKLVAAGNLFALDFATDTNCLDSSLTPCAVLNNSPVVFDTSIFPIQYSISDTAQILTHFIWEPNCDHLEEDGSPRSYYFFLSAQDNHCSVPGKHVASIEVQVVADSNNCGFIFTSVPETKFQEQFKAFPNPTAGEIIIESSSASQRIHLQVRNIHGQLVEEKELIHSNRMEVALQGEKGIYFIQLTNEKGERANLKVIKQ